MHAATSFYRPTLPDWENRAPSLLSRAPGDETLRSALVEALDLSQRLCTTTGHERLLGLLGGGNGGAVEALTRALVGAIEHNNDRRVAPICALAARTLTSWPSAALAAVRAARRAGVDAIVARLEHTVVDLTIHSCTLLHELEDALRFGAACGAGLGAWWHRREPARDATRVAVSSASASSCSPG